MFGNGRDSIGDTSTAERLEGSLGEQAQSASALREEVSFLNAQVLRQEASLVAARADADKADRAAAATVSRACREACAAITSVFAALPPRATVFESGRTVVCTRGTTASRSSAPALSSANVGACLPAAAGAVCVRVFRSSNSEGKAKGSTEENYDDDEALGGFVRVAVRFRTEYGADATPPRVTVWLLAADCGSVERVPPPLIKTTAAGFAFELRQKDLGAAHNMVVNWIAVTDPPKNPALQTLLAAILAQISGNEGDASSSNAELEKAVSKFVHSNGTEAADTNGQTLLHAAASAGNERLVRYLVGKGARVNAVDEHGWTALLCAVSAGHLGLAIELLDSGADGTVVTESGSNGLHYLARWPGDTKRYDDVLDRLLGAGCDVNCYNNDGDTVVNVFCQRGASAEAVEKLLEHGGSVSVANARGLSPLHAAVMNDNVDVVRVLCRHGADPNFVAQADVGSPYTMALAQKRTKILAVFAAAASAASSGVEREPRLAGRFHVKVVEARGITRVADLYCVLENGGHAHRTRVAAHTDRPHWEQRVVLESPADRALRVSVWTFSLTKSCTLLGRAALDLSTCGARADVWLPLLPVYASASSSASACACASSSSSAAAADAPAGPELHLTVHHHVEDTRRRLRATTRMRAMGQVLQPSPPPSPSSPCSRSSLMAGAHGTLVGSAVLANQSTSKQQLAQQQLAQQPACEDDGFVSWQFPEEEWAEPRSVAGCEWCVDAAGCVAHGYCVEASRAAVVTTAAATAGTTASFDHHACVRHYAQTLAPRAHSTVYAVVYQQPVVASVEEAGADRARAVIVRTSKEDVRTVVPPAPSAVAAVQGLAGALGPELDARAEWRCARSAAAVAALVRYEQLVTVANYRFGVLYGAPGDRTEAQLFARRAGSAAYERFLESLGRRVALRGWDAFRGGLDVRTGETGRESLYTRYGAADPQLEIMFHVATMLPYRADDPQQIERKRHIGNDVCVLVYKDAAGPDDTVDIASFRSHFNNVFVVVSPVVPATSPASYRVAVVAKQATHPFPPLFPETGNVFVEGPAFRQWLLEKLINGERMTMETPEYRSRLMNPRKVLLMDVIKQCQQSSQ